MGPARARIRVIVTDKHHLQAYDDRIQRAQLNKQAWDEERERRNKEREEWARQAKERSEARMKARAELYDDIRKIKEQKEVHAKLVEQFYQELCDRNPEWEIRRQEVLKVAIFLCPSPASSYVHPCSAKKCESRDNHPHGASNFYGRILISLWDLYLFQTCCTMVRLYIPTPPILSIYPLMFDLMYIAVDLSFVSRIYRVYNAIPLLWLWITTALPTIMLASLAT